MIGSERTETDKPCLLQLIKALIMKSYLQQLKPTFSLYKGASLLLFIFLMSSNLNSQAFYYVKGTKITIHDNTTFYITDSGNVDQVRLRNFEGEILIQKQTLHNTKNLTSNEKKSKSGPERVTKQSISKSSKEKIKTFPKIESVEFLKLCPDNFFSTYQKGIAISVSVPNIQYHSKFLIENIRYRLLHIYPKNTNNEIINNNLNFFKDYHLSQYITRPPPPVF
ncbi:hypothetical protein ACM39_06765 [Chryseobacterium sp. FH2]|nr:hypothetical protein ACM39_06765 [Chryseobacterium sp. FH2]